MFKQLAILVILASQLIYGMNCTEFNSFRQHNGHWYTITHNRLTFSNAKAYAEANNGYLAIPDNAAENSFLSSIMSRDAAWIGVFDPAFIQNQCNVDSGASCFNDDSRFRTVKGGSLTYKNWNYAEPNNAVYNTDFLNGRALVSPTGEYWVVLGAGGKWADVGNHIKGNAEKVQFQALLEFDAMPSCATQPTDNTDAVDQIGTGGKAVCDTSVYNPELNITTPHKTFDCQVDQSGTQYCPYMLAECGSEWDYEDGYSGEHNSTNAVVYDKIRVWTGRIGDNYWSGSCGLFHSTAYFSIEDVDKVLEFTLKKTIFDDWIKVTLNGHIVRVGPYGGDDLFFVSCVGCNDQCNSFKRGKCTSDLYNKVGYNSSNYDVHGACELRTSWNQSHNIDAKGYLKNGANKVEIEVVVSGGGEGYAYFEGISARGNVNCTGGNCRFDDIGDHTVYEDYTYYDYLCHNGTAIDNGGDCGGEPLIDTNGDGVGDSCNSPNPPSNNCKKERFVCQSDKDRPCVNVNNKMQCSPFPCFGQGDVVDLDTPTGIDDKNNDGWTEAGNCSGQIYIFNGQDNRCRSKMAFGIVDDCCSHDAFLFSLIECKDYEQILDRKKEDKRCHYVGDYCSDKVLGACVQKKKTFCCFNSKLARIIVEEGRKQLKDLDWGEAKHPNCRGFTPEEFEKIDFSRIDLTEFTDDIQSQINVSNIQNTADRLKDKINNMQGN